MLSASGVTRKHRAAWLKPTDLSALLTSPFASIPDDEPRTKVDPQAKALMAPDDYRDIFKHDHQASRHHARHSSSGQKEPPAALAP
jgi:hypothetical protein